MQKGKRHIRQSFKAVLVTIMDKVHTCFRVLYYLFCICYSCGCDYCEFYTSTSSTSINYSCTTATSINYACTGSTASVNYTCAALITKYDNCINLKCYSWLVKGRIITLRKNNAVSRKINLPIRVLWFIQ